VLTGLLLEELSLDPLLLNGGELESLDDELLDGRLLELEGEDQELLGDDGEIDDDGDGDDASDEPDEVPAAEEDVPAADERELTGGFQLDETPLVDDVGGLDDPLDVGAAELEKPTELESLEELLLYSDELKLLEGELLLEEGLELLKDGLLLDDILRHTPKSAPTHFPRSPSDAIACDGGFLPYF